MATTQPVTTKRHREKARKERPRRREDSTHVVEEGSELGVGKSASEARGDGDRKTTVGDDTLEEGDELRDNGRGDTENLLEGLLEGGGEGGKKAAAGGLAKELAEEARVVVLAADEAVKKAALLGSIDLEAALLGGDGGDYGGGGEADREEEYSFHGKGEWWTIVKDRGGQRRRVFVRV